jgi:hypothetical protein
MRKPHTSPARQALNTVLNTAIYPKRGRKRMGLWTQLQQDHLDLFGTPFNKDAISNLIGQAGNDWKENCIQWIE